MAVDYQRALELVRGPWSFHVVPLGIIWTVQLLLLGSIFPSSVWLLIIGLFYSPGLAMSIGFFLLATISLFSMIATIFEAFLFSRRPDTIRGVEWSSGFYLGSSLCKAIAWTLPCIGVLFSQFGHVWNMFRAFFSLLVFYLPVVYAWRVRNNENEGGAGALYI